MVDHKTLSSADIEKATQQFWKDGFVVVPDFFGPELMDEYDGLILDHYGMNPDFEHNEEFLETAATEVVPWFPQREGIKAFDLVQNCPDLNALTDSILGEDWYADYCMVMFSKSGTKGQAWHQDCSPDNNQQFNLNRLVYTSDITDEIGGQTLVVPGSHRLGELPSKARASDFPDKRILTPTKGTVVLLHGHTWHSVMPVSGAYRVSTNYRSAPKGTPEGITDICVYQNMRYRFSTNSIVEERV